MCFVLHNESIKDENDCYRFYIKFSILNWRLQLFASVLNDFTARGKLFYFARL